MVGLTIPRASDESWFPWDTPNSWMQVKPVDDPQEQRRLEQVHEREVAEAEAHADTRGYGYGTHHDEDGEEEWDEQTVSWHDDKAWSWALIPPDAARGSPWHWQEPENEAPSTNNIAPSEPEAGPSLSPESEPTPENAPASPSYSPLPSPRGWPTPDPSTGGWGSPGYVPQPAPGGWG